MTAQLGDGAAIAAATGIHTVSDLRAMDVALGGQGAPVVPVGDQLLWPGYDYYLNLGGIANITWYTNGQPIAFDVCPANRVLNMLAATEGNSMDRGGVRAKSGKVNGKLLEQLNAFPYYQQPPPKSLANEFGSEQLFPILQQSGTSVADGLRTYVEHIAVQVSNAVAHHRKQISDGHPSRLLATGGGGHNHFLIECIRTYLDPLGVELLVPDPQTVDYKEAIVMAFMGVLRWREENNVYASVTGAKRDSAGGAFWLGH
jgi:anhydro-N-acetylmuramic acid kinase